MWVITVFENNSVRIFEYTEKAAAEIAMKNFSKNAVLSYTNNVA